MKDDHLRKKNKPKTAYNSGKVLLGVYPKKNTAPKGIFAKLKKSDMKMDKPYIEIRKVAWKDNPINKAGKAIAAKLKNTWKQIKRIEYER